MTSDLLRQDEETEDLRATIRRLMDRSWRAEGYTSPNPETYPWQWLWDSCFHAIVWACLEDERGLTEIESLFSRQTDDGFVPHMGYQADPEAACGLWGRPGASTITQPPMYAHALRVLTERGLEPGGELVERAGAGLEFLWKERMRADGLLVIVHPWESGCDDSPRWDSWAPDPFDKATWDATKRRLLGSLLVDGEGSAVANPDFEVASVVFNALCAFNAREYARLTADSAWRRRGDELAAAVRARWDGQRATFLDGDHPSASAPTLDALVGILAVDDREHPAWSLIADEDRFAGPYGLRGVDPSDPSYDPDAYWRGPTWPQLDYLIWLAAVRVGRSTEAAMIAARTTRGAVASRFAEYWNPDTGAGHGAIPQAWSGLVLPMIEGVGP